MLTIHCTRKLLDFWPATETQGEPTTTVLGNWYANILDIEPDVVLFMNEKTLLAIPVMAAPIDDLYARFVNTFAFFLDDISVPREKIIDEIQQMRSAQITKTASQSKVASANDQAQRLKLELFSMRRPSLEKAMRRLTTFPYAANDYRTTPEMVMLAFNIDATDATTPQKKPT
jgi:hypothetical protein